MCQQIPFRRNFHKERASSPALSHNMLRTFVNDKDTAQDSFTLLDKKGQFVDTIQKT